MTETVYLVKWWTATGLSGTHQPTTLTPSMAIDKTKAYAAKEKEIDKEDVRCTIIYSTPK